MKEILAQGLAEFFTNSGLSGCCTYKGEMYEVWEVSDAVFYDMNNMSEEKFESLCPDGMWRYSTGSIFGVPGKEYIINDKPLKAWDDRRERYIREDCNDCVDKQQGFCMETENDYNECFGERKYRGLLEYLCEEIGASQPRNVCALAMDLARANNMKMGELFSKYE